MYEASAQKGKQNCARLSTWCARLKALRLSLALYYVGARRALTPRAALGTRH